MSIYIHICILYVYTSVYIYILCISVYVYTCIHAYMHRCKHACMCVYIYTYVCIYIYVCVYVYINIPVYVYVCIYIYLYMCMFMYLYLYMYSHHIRAISGTGDKHVLPQCWTKALRRQTTACNKHNSQVDTTLSRIEFYSVEVSNCSIPIWTSIFLHLRRCCLLPLCK